jgi:hypothetical protein
MAMQCKLVTVLGNDTDSEWPLAELAASHVEVIGIRSGDRRLSRCIVLVEPDRSRTIVNGPLVLEEANVVGYLGQLPEQGRPHCVHLDGFQVAGMSFSTEMWRAIILVSPTRCRAASAGHQAPFQDGAHRRARVSAFNSGRRRCHSVQVRRSANPLVRADGPNRGHQRSGDTCVSWHLAEPRTARVSAAVAIVGASHSITAVGALGLCVTAQDLHRWSQDVPRETKRAARHRAGSKLRNPGRHSPQCRRSTCS